MTYPKAYEGVKKLVIAETLELIASGLTVILNILSTAALSGITAAREGSDIAAVGVMGASIGLFLIGIIILVIGIISEVFTFIGLKKASVDEPGFFMPAFFISIILFVMDILSGLFSSVEVTGLIIKTSTKALSVAIYTLTIFGIRKLAKKLEKEDVIKLANITAAVEIFQICVNSVSDFTGGILETIASILSFVGYIIFIIFLTKARDMLDH